jgi:type I restriction enzyme S subunit
MIDSNIFLPKSWTWTTLGEVVEFEYGKGLIESKRDPSGKIPVYGSNGVVGFHSSALVGQACLIVGRKGAAGRVHISRGPCWPIDTTYYIVPPPGLDLSFAYYLISTLQLGSLDRSTAIPGLNRNDAYSLPLPLPPLPEQRRIVAKIEELFSKLDAGVEALKKVKAELKRYRQAVLKYAFEGKLTEEWRKKQLEIAESEIAELGGKLNIAESESGKSKIAELESGKLENEKMQISKFPDFQISNLPFEPASVLLERIKEERKKKLGSKYKDLPPLDTSELPDLPEGWAWARLGELCFVQGGFAFKSRDYRQSGVPLLRISNIVNGKVSFQTETVYLDDAFLSEYQAFVLSQGDIVIALSGATTGKYGVYDLDEPALLNQRVGRLRFSDDATVNPRFILQYLEIIRGRILKEAYGAAQPNISTNDLGEFEIPLAPKTEQDQIVSEIERRFSVADEVEKVVDQSLKQAERLRQSILKRAFEGKLVPQDPTDPPAIQLLEEIRKQKENAAATTRKGQHSLRRASQSASVLVERIKKEKEKQTAKVAKKRKGK